jgi:hypothetical protein
MAPYHAIEDRESPRLSYEAIAEAALLSPRTVGRAPWMVMIPRLARRDRSDAVHDYGVAPGRNRASWEAPGFASAKGPAP